MGLTLILEHEGGFVLLFAQVGPNYLGDVSFCTGGGLVPGGEDLGRSFWSSGFTKVALLFHFIFTRIFPANSRAHIHGF